MALTPGRSIPRVLPEADLPPSGGALARLPESIAVHIRSEVGFAIARGFSVPELKGLRDGLARDLGLSPAQVRAASAHLRINAQRLLARSEISASVTPDTLIGAMFGDKSAHESLVQFLGRQKAAELLGAYYESAPGLPQPPTYHASLTDSPPVTVEQPEGEGTNSGAAFTNYDFAAKVAWRNKWYAFLKTNLPARELRDATVLCLPSRYPEREIKGYLELGIQPHNITAVEGDPRVREEFAAACHRLGVRHVCGLLQDILPQLKTMFSIVSYDFPGPFCAGYQDILEKTPVAQKAALLVNLMAKRENAHAQARLANSTASHKLQFWDDIRADLFRDMRTDKPIESFNYEKKVDEYTPESVAEQRAGAAESTLVARLGMFRLPHAPLLTPEATHAATFMGMGVSLEQLFQLYKLPAGYSLDTIKILPWIIVGAATTINKPSAVERWEYRSDASSARTKFISTFAVINRPVREQYSWRKVVAPLVETEKYAHAHQKSPGAAIVHPKLKLSFPPGVQIPSSALLELSCGERKLHIPVRELFQTCDEVARWGLTGVTIPATERKTID